MLNSRFLSVRISFLITFFCLSSALEASTIRSLAVFKHLNAPLYFAALYSERPNTSLNEWRDNTVAREMEYRFTAERISMRSFSRQVLERILINNNPQDLDRHSTEIQKFIKSIRQSYQKGDRLQVVFRPEQPVELQINGVKVTTFTDSGIFNVLLNGWIGEKLQGQTFYKELAGSLSSKKLSEYDRLVLNAKRVSWAKGLQVAEAAPVVAQVPTKPVVAAVKPKPKKVQPKPKPVVAKKTPKPKPKPKVVAKKPVVKPVVKATRPPRQVATVTKKPPVKTVAPQPKPKEVPPKKPEMNPLLQELFSSYLEELDEAITAKVNPWPPRNLRRLGKGDMVVEITINRKGAITGVKMKDNPLGQVMADVVSKTLLKVTTLPKAPEVLPQKSYVIEKVYNFKKCKRTPSAWLCF